MNDQARDAIRAVAEAEADADTLKHIDQLEEQKALDASREEALKLARKVDSASGREQTDAVQELRDVLEPASSLPLAHQVEEAYGLDKPAHRTDRLQRVLSELDSWSCPPEPFAMAPDDSVWRDWVIPGWLPAGRVTRLSSHGGSGKTYLALELATSIAAAADPEDGSTASGIWRAYEGVGSPVLARSTAAPGFAETSSDMEKRRKDSKKHNTELFRLAPEATPAPVLFLTWEDEPEEFGRRLAWIPSGRGEAIEGRLHGLYMERSGPLWGPRAFGHIDTVATLTATGRFVEDRIRRLRPRLVVIDPVAAAYAGSENDRAAVRRWLSHLNALAHDTGAAILIVSHPPKASGASYSGSTDWDNGVRAAWTLDPANAPGCRLEDGDRAQGLALTLSKSNYSRVGQRIWLRWTEREGRRGLEQCSPVEAAEAWHANRNERVNTDAGPNGAPKKEEKKAPRRKRVVPAAPQPDDGVNWAI